MTSYTTRKFLDDYNDDTLLDLYNKLDEEEQVYYNEPILPYHFPETLCVFIDFAFYDSLYTSGENDILIFVSLYIQNIYNDLLINLSYDEYYYTIDCIQAFINSDFGNLPQELIAIILISKYNYFKFLTL